ncbi:hypothetical protein AAG570_013915 [Ranatra chinensis]|uniref:Dehydrogenase/reductase SDR family member 4 n=1 Tax=Ranatra chinensis TaxID=642074 RepID=A0ABD0YW32_9HEMI
MDEFLFSIGFAIAERLGRSGASLVISSRKGANVERAVEKLKKSLPESSRIVGTTCHVAKKQDREALYKKAVDSFGGIDILVSNAAVNPVMGAVTDCPEEAWDKIFEINVKSAFMLTKEVIPYMEKRGGGSIVYVSSIAGYQPINALGAYSVSKTALLGLTKAVSVDLAQYNIRVNAIAPGIVKTKFSSSVSYIYLKKSLVFREGNPNIFQTR